MTLKAAALNVLSASQAGFLDSVDMGLEQIASIASTPQDETELVSAMAILQQARAEMQAHRAAIADSLQKLEKSCLYNAGSVFPSASWEIAG